jgi:hypothetical protein
MLPVMYLASYQYRSTLGEDGRLMADRFQNSLQNCRLASATAAAVPALLRAAVAAARLAAAVTAAAPAALLSLSALSANAV